MDLDSISDLINKHFDSQTADNIRSWLQDSFPEEVRKEIVLRLKSNPESLVDSFYKNLSFGTGGLRGIVGIGTNRINVFNIRRATRALVKYLETVPFQDTATRHKVIIGYDTRVDSALFAEEAAAVLSGSGIDVLLFEKPRPVAMVSFGVIREKCSLGIMITASHNPPEYNGYKVYMNTGGQVVAPDDARIIEEFNRIRLGAETLKKQNDLIKYAGEQFDRAYIETVSRLQFYPKDNQEEGESLRIIYSPLHGAGLEIIPDLLDRWGFPNLELVEEQAVQDGRFPTVRSPNPEEKDALVLGIRKLHISQADIFLATDPDADRLGVVLRDEKDVVILDGNQIGVLLARHIFGSMSAKIKLNNHYKLVTTLVTGSLLKKIAERYGAGCVDVPTGFKYIGEKMALWEGTETIYVFGAEESYGYLYGDYAKDKDAAGAAALIAELALQAKLQSKTLLDFLFDIYNEYGFYVSKTVSKTFSGKIGEEKIKSLMDSIRAFGRNEKKLGSRKIVRFEDYLSGDFDYKLDIVRFFTEDGCRIICRPSGTETKIKFYFELSQRYDDSVSDSMVNRDRLKQTEIVLEAFIEEVSLAWKLD